MSGNPSSSPLSKRGKILSLFFLLIILSVYPLPSYSSNLHKYHQVSMGTVIEITLLTEDEETAQKAVLQAFQEIKRIEQLMSPWIVTSDVSRLSRSAGKEWIKVSPETFEVIQTSQKISGLSEGAFDITIGPLIQLWRKARERGVPPPSEEVKKVLVLVNFRNLLIRPDGKVFLKKEGMAIDLGGIAKGYAVDRALEILRSLGYKNLIINAGGDLRTGGLKNREPWSIGIQNPRSAEKVIATISVSDSAIATSGDYQKFFFHQGKRYHHILNPKTGFPAEECQSVTILCKDGMTADGLATAVFVLGHKKGYALCQRLEGVKCFIVDREGRAVMTPGLKEWISFTP
jgi:thiamine biosynthesis lipoprotein